MADIQRLPWETDDDYQRRVAELHANMPLDYDRLQESYGEGIKKTLVDREGRNAAGEKPVPMKGADVGLRITRPDGQSKVTSYDNYDEMQQKFGSRPGYKLDTVQIYAVEKDGVTKLIEDQYLDRAKKAGASVIPRDEYKVRQNSERIKSAMVDPTLPPQPEKSFTERMLLGPGPRQEREPVPQPRLVGELAKDVKGQFPGVFEPRDAWRAEQAKKIAAEEEENGAGGIYLGRTANMATFGTLGRAGYRQEYSPEELKKIVENPPGFWENDPEKNAIQRKVFQFQLANPGVDLKSEEGFGKFYAETMGGSPEDIAKANQDRAELRYRDSERERMHKIAGGLGDITGAVIGMGPFKGAGGAVARGSEGALAKRGIVGLGEEYAGQLAAKATANLGPKALRNALLARVVPAMGSGAVQTGAFQAAQEIPRLSDQPFGFDALMESAGNVLFATALGAVPLVSTRVRGAVKNPITGAMELSGRMTPMGTVARDINAHERLISSTIKNERDVIARFNPGLAARDARIGGLKESLESTRRAMSPDDEAVIKSLTGDIGRVKDPLPGIAQTKNGPANLAAPGIERLSEPMPGIAAKVAPTLRRPSRLEVSEIGDAINAEGAAMDQLLPQGAREFTAKSQMAKRSFPEAELPLSKYKDRIDFKIMRKKFDEHMARMDANVTTRPGEEVAGSLESLTKETAPIGKQGSKANKSAPTAASPREIADAMNRLESPPSPEILDAYDKYYGWGKKAPGGRGKGGFLIDQGARIYKQEKAAYDSAVARGRGGEGETTLNVAEIPTGRKGRYHFDDVVEAKYKAKADAIRAKYKGRDLADIPEKERAIVANEGIPGARGEKGEGPAVWKKLVDEHNAAMDRDLSIVEGATKPILHRIDAALVKAGGHRPTSVQDLLSKADEAVGILEEAGETAAADMLRAQVGAARVSHFRVARAMGARSEWITDEAGIPPRAESPEGRYEAPASARGPAGVPFMITREMRAKLAQMGVSAEEIGKLTPAEAHARIGAIGTASNRPPITPRDRSVLSEGYLGDVGELGSLQRGMPWAERAAAEQHLSSIPVDTGPRVPGEAFEPWAPFDSKQGAGRPAWTEGEPGRSPTALGSTAPPPRMPIFKGEETFLGQGAGMGGLAPGSPGRRIKAGENRSLGSKLWGEVAHAGEGIARTLGRSGAKAVGRSIAEKALGGIAVATAGGGLPGFFSRLAVNAIGGRAFGKAFDHTMDAVGSSNAWQETTKERVSSAISGKGRARPGPLVKRTLVSAVNESVLGKASESDNLLDVVGKKIEQVRRAALNPEAVKDHMWEQMAPLRSVDQPMSEKLIDHVDKTIKFLNRVLPKDPDAGKFGPKQSFWKPNEEQANEAARYIVAAANPVKAFLDELDSGDVSPETMETLQELQPEAFKWLQTQAMEAVVMKGGDIPHAKRLALSRALAINLEPTDEPEFSYGIGQFFAENAAAQSKKPGASGGTMKTGGGLATPTRSQRYMG